MKVQYATLLLCFVTVISTAQITSRIQIEGKIDVPIGDEIEGVVVYNRNTNQGTITNADGFFKILAGNGDRIEVVAMQYQHFVVVVNQGIIQSKKVHIFLSESINQLDEVVVTPYDLKGNVKADVKKIGFQKSGIATVSKETSVKINESDYDFRPDTLSSIEDRVMLDNTSLVIDGLNFVNLFKLAFNNKRNLKKISKDVDVAIRNMYNDDFFQNFLALEIDEINDFIFFAQDNGLNNSYFNNGKELDLLQFLTYQSKLYKQNKM